MIGDDFCCNMGSLSRGGGEGDRTPGPLLAKQVLSR